MHPLALIVALGSCKEDDHYSPPPFEMAPSPTVPPIPTPPEIFDWACSPTEVAEVVGVGTFAALGAALAQMPDGGEVIVCAGTHPGAFVVEVSGTIRSREGAVFTTLFGLEGEPTFTIGGPHTVVLEGFTVSAGAMGASVDQGAIAALRDCRITANDGYGVWAHPESALTVDGTEVSDNGGTGLVVDHATLLLQDSVVRGNADGAGGGISLVFGDATLVRSEVVENAAESAGGGVHGQGTLTLDSASRFADNTARVGGNVYLLGPSTVTGGTYEGGVATDEGGGLYLIGNYNEPVELVDLVVRGNSATYGGGVFYYGVQLAITGGEYEDNQADSWGGGLAGAGSEAVVTGARITGNAAAVGGAASLDPGWGTFLAVEVDWGVLGLDANTPNEVTVDEVVYPVDGVSSFACDLPAAAPCAF